MDDGELMTIGRFARLSGVSAHTLRHYDDVGLLRPYEVDAASGYRRYQRAQIRAARLIQALRNVGLPIEEVRQILDAPSEDEVNSALVHHRRRLELERSRLDDRVNNVDRYLEKGIPMPVVQSGCRPVQIRIAVDDAQSSVDFYVRAFGLDYEVARRTQSGEARAFVFGEYGQDDFFLFWLTDDPNRFDRPGTSTFSFLVEDLDVTHANALSAGATEVSAPYDAEGMPRSSAIKDPEGMRRFAGVPDDHAEWFDRYRRLSATRGLRSSMFRGGFAGMDVRHILTSIHVSTLVVEHKQWVQAGPGRYIADRIKGARFIELPDGAFAEWRFEDPDRVVEVVREFVTGEKGPPPPVNRVLATVLFTDVVGSTSANAQKGDRRWTQTLDAFDAFAKRQVERYGGRFIKSTGDGHLATFDSPGRAILCACAQRDGVGRFEIAIRAGLHTGEIELRGEDIGGLAVNIGRRVCDAASDDEVLVSSSIPPLVAGSGIDFDDLGEHELKGVPGRWQLYAVKS